MLQNVVLFSCLKCVAGTFEALVITVKRMSFLMPATLTTTLILCLTLTQLSRLLFSLFLYLSHVFLVFSLKNKTSLSFWLVYI